MLDWITGIMEQASYMGITFLMFLENAFPPIPSELIMPLAGFTAEQGRLSLMGVALAGGIGSVLGSLPLFYLARAAGEERIKDWADRYGTWIAFSSDEVKKIQDWFDHHGEAAVFIGRLLPGFRTFIPLPAGLSHMSLGKYLLYSTPGTVLWAGFLAYLGYLLGENYDKVSEYLAPFTCIGLGVGVIAWGIQMFRFHRDRKTRKQAVS